MRSAIYQFYTDCYICFFNTPLASCLLPFASCLLPIPYSLFPIPYSLFPIPM
ncbi:MAG: hypothetical protein F6J90_18305 [Moorea sp. SIOASIH]|uniref:hypothetical protein n=1 Tax=Moorena sp. SIOASIH TaxID=2607817 RepID=UPI0013BCF2AC|nr:hypothetical protein [Moorena sp. SIOASIH]NEO38174.1 hypothetical protein [Moorena sp. SIOASIH]